MYTFLNEYFFFVYFFENFFLKQSKSASPWPKKRHKNSKLQIYWKQIFIRFLRPDRQPGRKKKQSKSAPPWPKNIKTQNYKYIGNKFSPDFYVQTVNRVGKKINQKVRHHGQKNHTKLKITLKLLKYISPLCEM